MSRGAASTFERCACRLLLCVCRAWSAVLGRAPSDGGAMWPRVQRRVMVTRRTGPCDRHAPDGHLWSARALRPPRHGPLDHQHATPASVSRAPFSCEASLYVDAPVCSCRRHGCPGECVCLESRACVRACRVPRAHACRACVHVRAPCATTRMRSSALPHVLRYHSIRVTCPVMKRWFHGASCV